MTDPRIYIPSIHDRAAWWYDARGGSGVAHQDSSTAAYDAADADAELRLEPEAGSGWSERDCHCYSSIPFAQEEEAKDMCGGVRTR